MDSAPRSALAQQSRRRFRALALPAVAAVALSISSRARAEDVSAPPILQMFESSWRNIENRTPDIFATGYGGMWGPPPARADAGTKSVGDDGYNSVDLCCARRCSLSCDLTRPH